MAASNWDFRPKKNWGPSTTAEGGSYSEAGGFKIVKPKQFKTELGLKISNQTIEDPHLYLKEHIKQPEIADLLFPDLQSVTLVTDRVCHTLRAGKIYRYRVTAAVGNKKGVIGLGVGKHKFKDKAFLKAVNQAKKNLLYLKSSDYTMDFSDHRQIVSAKIPEENESSYYGPNKVTQAKLGRTIIEVAPLISNSITASKWGLVYCKLAGFTRIRIRAVSKDSVASRMNYYKTLHQAIKLQTAETY